MQLPKLMSDDYKIDLNDEDSEQSDSGFDFDAMDKQMQQPKKSWGTMIYPGLLAKMYALKEDAQLRGDEISFAEMVDKGLRMFIRKYEDEHGEASVERRHRSKAS